MVAAHRGHFVDLPENSLAAIRKAAELGAEVVEIDVRHSLDDQVLLMHDAELDRTTTGSGKVEDFTFAEIAELRLNGGIATQPETTQIPLFGDALALAIELGVMLYVDEKTPRSDLVREDIVRMSALEHAFIRTNLTASIAHVAEEPQLLVMPQVANLDELDAAATALPTLRIVETASSAVDVELYAKAKTMGIKVQQDVFIADVPGAAGNYLPWKEYVDGGVFLLQTNVADVLIPAVWQYRQDGVFPSSGPPADR